MGENFLRFKRKNNLSRILKSLLYGISAGVFCAGLFLLFAKLNLLKVNPLFCLPVGVLAGAIGGGVCYFLFKKSDAALARELDSRFALKERVETMLAYQATDGELVELQREDTERSLASVPTKAFKLKRLWISFLSVGVGAATLLAALLVPNLQNEKPVEEVIPFTLTDMQRVGMKGLIVDVKKSEMEEPYRTQISGELERLLQTLEGVRTQAEMEEEVGKSMTLVWTATADSSAMTEIANALWGTGDEYSKALANAVNTSSWEQPEWGDYAEKWSILRALYEHTAVEGENPPDESALHTELKWKLENSALKIGNALLESGIESENSLYTAIDELVNANEGAAIGLKSLSAFMGEHSYEESLAALNGSFESLTEGIYDAISVQKINTNVGEHAMKKLSTLFLVPLPKFERPDLSKGGSGSESEKDEEGKENDETQGGIGGGATYGSDDYVLDPLTGEYVKYGTLLSKYYALMNEKLNGDTYSESEKEAIKKYFDLLFSGIKKDEGSEK